MTEENQNKTIYAGDSHTLRDTVVDKDGDAKNISGADIIWQLFAIGSDGEPTGTALISKSTGDSPATISISDGAGGIFDVTVDPEDTEDLSGRYYHVAKVTDGSGDIATVTTGYIYIK